MNPKRRDVLAWSVFDLANTAFSALFVTFFYPYYVKNFLGGNEFQIGAVFGLSMLLVGFVVPFIGAYSDITYKRKPLLIFFTLSCIIFTALVSFAGLTSALVFGFLANFSYHAGLTLYNALLVNVSKKDNIGAVSGTGTSMGYLGTILSLAMAYLLLQNLGWDSLAGIKSIFVATAIFFLVFSSVTFIVLREKESKRDSSFRSIYLKVSGTIKGISSNGNVARFLLSQFFIADAMNTVIIFLFLYGNQEIGLTVKSFMGLFVIFSIFAAISALLFGKLADYIGPKRTIIIAIFFWFASVFALLLLKTYNSFVVAGLLGGIGIGGIATASRPMLLCLIRPRNAGEFFGYLEFTGKLSGFLGPIVFGFLAAYFSYQYALMSLLVFFLLGLIFIVKVNANGKVGWSNNIQA